MSKHLESYRISRSRDRDPVADLSDEALELPAAALRGARSFYDDLAHAEGAVRVCHGTSCALAGADALRADLETRVPCRTAYCLGYCDRSPIVLDLERRVLRNPTSGQLMGDADADEPGSAPDIRNDADTPIITERIALGSHAGVADAQAAGLYDALQQALLYQPEGIVRLVVASGERGRGGAAYPTGTKWQVCAATDAPRKYVVANGDEGDPGSYIDRVLMEMDPHAILVGMAIAGFAVGANEGIVFIRSEYPRAGTIMREAIREAERTGLLGESVMGTDFSFRVRVFTAMGSYVCGEETAMLNAIEGMRGEVQLRPPYPAESGLYGMPTLVDNVETLVNVPWIVSNGPDAYRAVGTKGSSGTKAVCLNHGFKRPGIVEVEFGTRLETVINEYGCGSADDRTIAAVVVGGPMGSIIGPEDWDVPFCYDAMSERGFALGHAGIVALHAPVDWRGLLRHWLQFMQHESCGKCVPCRLGSQRALEWALSEDISITDERFDDMFMLMEEASLCGFGKEMPKPMRTILQRIRAGDTK